jgi:hypothetical protein
MCSFCNSNPVLPAKVDIHNTHKVPLPLLRGQLIHCLQNAAKSQEFQQQDKSHEFRGTDFPSRNKNDQKDKWDKGLEALLQQSAEKG